MAFSKDLHWSAPATMVSSLLAAILFALGHHLFYTSLNDQTVPTGSYDFIGKHLAEQQFNTSVGVAFALFAKVFLSVALTAAYVQVFWLSTLKAKRPFTLAELDWAYTGFSNLYSLLKIQTGYKFPTLLLLIFIFWCIPIATLFPPATLSIQSKLKNSFSKLEVPQVDFITLDFAAPLVGTRHADPKWDRTYDWSGPSQPLQHVALAVMGLGQVLPIAPPVPNASWTLDFWGPALQCDDVMATQKDRIWTSVFNSYNQDSSAAYSFMSWLPWSNSDTHTYAGYGDPVETDRDLPFFFNGSDKSEGWGTSVESVSFDGPVSLYIAVLPQSQYLDVSSYLTFDSRSPDGIQERKVTFANGSHSSSCLMRGIKNLTDKLTHGCEDGSHPILPSWAFENSTLLRCSLANTSYSLAFNYVDGVSNLTVLKSIDSLQGMNGSYNFYGPPKELNDTDSNCTTFQAYPSGNVWDGKPCFFDVEALRLLSYQSIMAAFNQLVLGKIQKSTRILTVNNITTTVMKTILAETYELAYMRNPPKNDVETLEMYPDHELHPNLQDLESFRRGRIYSELASPELPQARGDLKTTLEQLFQNFTVSLLAEPYFRPNYSSRFAPERLVNVSITESLNVYEYDQRSLWISYGIPIFLTSLAVLIGLTTLNLNGASYSHSFSTIVRFGRTKDLSVDISDKNDSGADPLPSYLKHARFYIGAKNIRPMITTKMMPENFRRTKSW